MSSNCSTDHAAGLLASPASSLTLSLEIRKSKFLLSFSLSVIGANAIEVPSAICVFAAAVFRGSGVDFSVQDSVVQHWQSRLETSSLSLCFMDSARDFLSSENRMKSNHLRNLAKKTNNSWAVLADFGRKLGTLLALSSFST